MKTNLIPNYSRKINELLENESVNLVFSKIVDSCIYRKEILTPELFAAYYTELELCGLIPKERIVVLSKATIRSEQSMYRLLSKSRKARLLSCSYEENRAIMITRLKSRKLAIIKPKENIKIVTTPLDIVKDDEKVSIFTFIKKKFKCLIGKK